MLLRYPVRVANKLELLDKAKQARVELGSWFESPLHPLELFEHHRLGYRVGQCPNAERAGRAIVTSASWRPYRFPTLPEYTPNSEPVSWQSPHGPVWRP